jgi:ribonucleoside-diphosphate reductase alpha chain
MEDIMRLAMSEAMLFKYGSGTGSDLSTLRSTREKLSGGGKPSGPLSFLKVYDQVANVVKSGGKTRRAAKMNTLKDWHPDIEEFIECKTKEERKAWALIEQGYDGSYNGDAYGSIMYQNENLSVRVSDEFMQRRWTAANGGPSASLTAEPCEKKDAKALLRKSRKGRTSARSRHAVRYHDRQVAHLQRHRPSEQHEPVLGVSLPRITPACNFASLHLLKFKRGDGSFDVERFKAACGSSSPHRRSSSITPATRSKRSRRIRISSARSGLGYANLGALIMSYGLGYDSEEGRALAGSDHGDHDWSCYEQSARMAKHMGPFPGYHDTRCSGVKKTVDTTNAPYMLEVIERHRSHISSSRPANASVISKRRRRRCGTVRCRSAGSMAIAMPR